ncbi:MAG: two-component regulator propeller domain-containing protein [Ferruginibacter sp.]
MAGQYTFKKLFSICLWLLISVKCFSQNQGVEIKNLFPFPAIEKITTQQGLSDNEVCKILQDRQGFLWFITANGLNRYDGYTFKVYAYDLNDSNSITSGLFYSLDQDTKGLLWMNSENDGIFSFDPQKEKFVNYRKNPGNINSLADDLTQGLVVDKNDAIWIATQNGLDKFEPAANHFTHYIHHYNDSSTISDNKILGICADEEGNLWLTTGSPGIDYFNSHTGKLIRHFTFGSSDTPVEDWQTHPYCAFKGRNGNVWIGSRQHGLFGFNIYTKKFINFYHDKNNINSISHNGVFRIYEDHNSNLWIATDAGMLDYYEKGGGKFYHYPLDDIYHIDIMEDRSKKIWVATQNGILAFNTRFKKINSWQKSKDQNAIPGNRVWQIFRSKEGKFIVSSDGISFFDTVAQAFSSFKIMENGKNVFTNNITWHIYEDSKNNIWFATSLGLISYNSITKKHHWYKYVEPDSSSLGVTSCTDIQEDRKGRYWVTTWGAGLASFDPVTGKFNSFKVHGGNNSISTNSLGDIFEDSHGMLYLGSQNGGVITFNPDNETFKIYRHHAGDPTSVSNDIAQNYIESKSARPDGIGSIIWFCTLGGGINAFNPVTGKFRAFTTKDGLCNNSVVSMVEDNKGNYWLGTLNGISCFTPPKNPFEDKDPFNFRNYNISDQLPTNKMNLFAAFKDVNGDIYFGTADAGMISFKPDELRDNDFVPPVYITDFKLFNRVVKPNDADSILKLSVELTKQIILDYNQNDISFEFAALNYIHPEKNQYAYRLVPFNKDWIYTDASKRTASYTNLDPGEYTFEIKASNNDGVWNQTPTIIHIVITPPFWQTWWFRTLMLLAFVGIVYAIHRYRLQQVLRLQNIRNRIASDLHDDIGSTLNSISIYSEVAKNDPSRRNLSLNMIGESSRKVIDAMSDIVWTINPDNDSFEKIILRLRSLSYNLLRAKNIEFTFKADETLNGLKLSLEKRRNFFLIFKEILNNLIKHSQAKRVQILLTHNSNTITLLVRDDGIGFDTTKKYNGNGLTNIRKRVKEINALVIIEAGAGIGTSIQLIFKS